MKYPLGRELEYRLGGYNLPSGVSAVLYLIGQWKQSVADRFCFDGFYKCCELRLDPTHPTLRFHVGKAMQEHRLHKHDGTYKLGSRVSLSRPSGPIVPVGYSVSMTDKVPSSYAYSLLNFYFRIEPNANNV